MSEAGNASILVVDDDVDTCHNLSDILTDLGYRVDTAYDGPAALDLVRTFDLEPAPAQATEKRHG